MIARFDDWSRGFDSRIDDVRELDRLVTQFDQVPRDARHVHQVVHEADHVVDLPFDHFVNLREAAVPRGGQSQQMQ